MLTYTGGSLCQTVAFDLVFFPLSLQISLDPRAAVRAYQVCLCGLEAQQKTVSMPRVKAGSSLFAPISSTTTSIYPVCAILPGGNGVGITTLSYPPGLVWTGATEKGQVQWSAGETQWAGLSWPPPDFCGHPLRGTWVLWIQKAAVLWQRYWKGTWVVLQGELCPFQVYMVNQYLRPWPYLEMRWKM